MTTRHLLAAAVLVAALSAAAHAQPSGSIPADALRAEASGSWDEAASLYQAALQRDPSRTDLWLRLADVEGARKNLAGALDALRHAARALPGDAQVFSKLSQAHALANQPAEALAAIEVAVAQDPESPAYLRARAVLATWAGEYGRARESYRRLAILEPEGADLLVPYARVASWDGATDEAASLYRRHLRQRDEDAGVWIELARTESWRGNHAAAADALEEYRRRFGATDAYTREFASLMAAAGRPALAREAVEPLLAHAPDDYQLNLTRALALAMQNRAGAAFEALDAARRVAPASRDTRAAEQLLRTRLSSSASPQASFYSDSDRLRIRRIEPRAALAFRSGTRLTLGYDQALLQARGGGLEQLDGSRSATHEQGWARLAQTVGRMTLTGQIGAARAERRERATHVIGAELTPVDGVRIMAERGEGFFVISPRTTGLGLTATTERVQLDVAPSLRYHLAVDVSHQAISDGNRRWEVTVSPRRSVARTSRLNLDLGVSTYVLATARDLDHGYYDPSRYEQHAVVLYPYFKVRENIGIGLVAALGAQRDRSTPDFRFGGSLSGEATLGIYQPWALKIGGSTTLNSRLSSGAYRGAGGTVQLIRRF